MFFRTASALSAAMVLSLAAASSYAQSVMTRHMRDEDQVEIHHLALGHLGHGLRGTAAHLGP